MPPTLLSDMASAIALANAAIRHADKIDRRLLMDARDRLTRYHAALAADLARPMGGPFGTNGAWGPNAREPGIRDIIRTVERIAKSNGAGARDRMKADLPLDIGAPAPRNNRRAA